MPGAGIRADLATFAVKTFSAHAATYSASLEKLEMNCPKGALLSLVTDVDGCTLL